MLPPPHPPPSAIVSPAPRLDPAEFRCRAGCPLVPGGLGDGGVGNDRGMPVPMLIKNVGGGGRGGGHRFAGRPAGLDLVPVASQTALAAAASRFPDCLDDVVRPAGDRWGPGVEPRHRNRTGPVREELRRESVLNAGWTAVFFGARAPRAALAENMALNVSNLSLLGRACGSIAPPESPSPPTLFGPSSPPG